MSGSLKGRIAVVTGASRGAGKGIATALGAHGATVYVTGRSQKEGDASMPGTIYATAEEVTKAGGKGIAVACDSGDDAQVAALIDRVIAEQGRIDILINNACAIYDELSMPGNFWEKPLKIGDMINVGVRSGFVASYDDAVEGVHLYGANVASTYDVQSTNCPVTINAGDGDDAFNLSGAGSLSGLVDPITVNAGITVHVRVLGGRDPHHIAEAEFKAFARAMRRAVELDPRVDGVPSTKGTL